VYSRLQISRLMVTTMTLITTVAPSRTGEFPASVARLITAPSTYLHKSAYLGLGAEENTTAFFHSKGAAFSL